jgi:hypothetical protein
MIIQRRQIEQAIRSASKHRQHKANATMTQLKSAYVAMATTSTLRAKREELTPYRAAIELLYLLISTDHYDRLISYKPKHLGGRKERDILVPDFATLILQHLCIQLLLPFYKAIDNRVGLNCKRTCGITAKSRRRSVIKRMKHLYYDRTDIRYLVTLDQRQCYAHVRVKVARRAMKEIGVPRDLINYTTTTCFSRNQLPIGTPTSPLIHHIVMWEFDRMVQQYGPCVRYADNIFVGLKDKDTAQELKWRIKNYWWYKLGIRAKRQSVTIVPMSLPQDVCGYILHRNPGRDVLSHDKGYVMIRRTTVDAARHSTNRNWGSYFGLMRHGDSFRLMTEIEKKMDLRKLTEKIRINRTLDAENISPKDLAEGNVEFTIYDYELRKDGKGQYNWLKCLIGYPEKDENGNLTGREVAREYHGNYSALIDWHVLCEQSYTKTELLPMTHCRVENSCGFIYKGSTNKLKYIENERS